MKFFYKFRKKNLAIICNEVHSLSLDLKKVKGIEKFHFPGLTLLAHKTVVEYWYYIGTLRRGHRWTLGLKNIYFKRSSVQTHFSKYIYLLLFRYFLKTSRQNTGSLFIQFGQKKLLKYKGGLHLRKLGQAPITIVPNSYWPSNQHRTLVCLFLSGNLHCSALCLFTSKSHYCSPSMLWAPGCDQQLKLLFLQH